MPRLRYIEEYEQTPRTRELIESARRTGAPDPRVVSLMTRSPLGIAWVEYWNKLLYQGILPHKLKELCRIKISVAHQYGAPHPDPSAYAKKFSGRYEHRTITGGIGHNLPQESTASFRPSSRRRCQNVISGLKGDIPARGDIRVLN